MLRDCAAATFCGAPVQLALHLSAPCGGDKYLVGCRQQTKIPTWPFFVEHQRNVALHHFSAPEVKEYSLV